MTLPDHIREWLAVNPDVPEHRLRCPRCGAWFEHIDALAPYHWETCWCRSCRAFPLMPRDEHQPSEDASAERQEQNRAARCPSCGQVECVGIECD